jgi:hypothetical protein
MSSSHFRLSYRFRRSILEKTSTLIILGALIGAVGGTAIGLIGNHVSSSSTSWDASSSPRHP